MINIATAQLHHGVAQDRTRLALTPAPFRQRLLAHKIAAGFPSPASDYIEDGLDLNEFLVHNKAASFLFTVSGNSMSGAGILDGDKVIVDRSVNPTHGKIVIAVINSEYTLKRLYNLNGIIELRAENDAYAPIRLVEGHELEIWGVVVGAIRKYRG
jgi:DNA polymerase V